MDVVGDIQLTGSLRQIGFTRIAETRPLMIMQLGPGNNGYQYNLTNATPGASLGGRFYNLFSYFPAAQSGATRSYRLKVISTDTSSFTYTIRLSQDGNPSNYAEYTFASAWGSAGESNFSYSSNSSWTTGAHVYGNIRSSTATATAYIYYIEMQALDTF